MIRPALAVLVLAGMLWPGRGSLAQTPDIHFVPTADRLVAAMLDAAKVTASDVVYDLGSGDGRIVIEAARKYGARGVGVELDTVLLQRSRRSARDAGVADKVTFVQGDLFKTNLSQATVVTLYLSNTVNMRLKPKLLRELRPGARVVSHRFGMPDWTPERTLSLDGAQIFLWTMKPATTSK